MSYYAIHAPLPSNPAPTPEPKGPAVFVPVAVTVNVIVFVFVFLTVTVTFTVTVTVTAIVIAIIIDLIYRFKSDIKNKELHMFTKTCFFFIPASRADYIKKSIIVDLILLQETTKTNSPY